MAGITLATAQTQLDAYLGITLWNQRVQDLTARQRRGRSVVPAPNF